MKEDSSFAKKSSFWELNELIDFYRGAGGGGEWRVWNLFQVLHSAVNKKNSSRYVIGILKKQLTIMCIPWTFFSADSSFSFDVSSVFIDFCRTPRLAIGWVQSRAGFVPNTVKGERKDTCIDLSIGYSYRWAEGNSYENLKNY